MLETSHSIAAFVTRVHEGNKQYQDYNLCGTRFAMRSGLKRHIKVWGKKNETLSPLRISSNIHFSAKSDKTGSK